MSTVTGLPRGYYAVPIFSGEDFDDDGGAATIGHQAFQVRRNGRRTGVTTYARPGIDVDKVLIYAWSLTDVYKIAAEDPDWSRAEYGRFASKCGWCGRTLTDPASKLRGIGPECSKGLPS